MVGQATVSGDSSLRRGRSFAPSDVLPATQTTMQTTLTIVTMSKTPPKMIRGTLAQRLPSGDVTHLLAELHTGRVAEELKAEGIVVTLDFCNQNNAAWVAELPQRSPALIFVSSTGSSQAVSHTSDNLASCCLKE